MPCPSHRPFPPMHLPNPRRSLLAYALALFGRWLPAKVLLALNRKR